MKFSNVLYLLLFVICLSFFLFPKSSLSATIYVNSSSGNDTTGTGAVDAPYATFHKAYTVSSASDTINLTGTFDWSNSAETGDSTTSGYTISKSLTITGQTANATIIQASSTVYTANRRIFSISGSGTTVTIQNVTLRYGYISSTDYEPSAVNMGSGSILTMLNTVVTQNANNGRFGSGAIEVNGSGKFIMRNSTVYSNNGITSQQTVGGSWYGYTGGIDVLGTNTGNEITNTTFYDNGAQYNGAIYVNGSSARLTVTNSTFIANKGITSGTDIHSYGGAQVYVKNNIFAQKASGATNALVVGASGTFNDGGNNIIETQGSAGFTNGVNGNLVGVQSSLNISSSLALNNATTGVLTLALSSGSVAIDTGTTTAHNSISVPTTDGRNFTRDASVDIGAYEYGASATDVTVPTVSITSPFSGGTVSGGSVSLTASASDNIGVAGVSFYIDSVLQGSEDTTSTYGITWDSTSTSTGAHTVFAVARDTSNNYATSTSVSFNVDNTSPAISSIASTTTSTTATITWTTDEDSSSLVRFGIVSGYGTTTSETDTSSRVTSHSITLVGLRSCIRYYFQVQSIDSGSNTTTSSAYTFRTSGCTGGANITTTGQDTISASSGGTLTEGNLTLTVPSSFTSATTSAVFQVQKINADTFFATAGTPTGKVRIGTEVFSLSALSDATTSISSFSNSLTVTLAYSDSDVSSYDESTLVIKRYDGSSWNSLSSCSVNTSANTVSCTTTAFSDFAIFGDSVSSSSSVYGNGPIFIGGLSNLIQSPTFQIKKEDNVKVEDTISITSTTTSATSEVYLSKVANVISAISDIENKNISKKVVEIKTKNNYRFERNLMRGMVGSDVLQLQKFLNNNGFVVSSYGNGSLGNETNYFGNGTKRALIEFQEFYKTEILLPNNLNKGTGLFGDTTRSFLNNFSI